MTKPFEFGKNWKNFLAHVDERRIEEAVQSLQNMMHMESLEGKTFVDIGSGSGLFSLAAQRLGARIHSFDFDQDSVECTLEMRRRFGTEVNWTVAQGSALDGDYLKRLGTFDIVYSWGVLHHTGNMWQAISNTIPMVKENGILFLALYNDQGGASRRWTFIKKLYVRSPSPLKFLLVLAIGLFFLVRTSLISLLKLENPWPLSTMRSGQAQRGMKTWHDLVDWVGGYPFEVARVDDVVNALFKSDLTLIHLRTCGSGHGCNEFVFQKRKWAG